MALAFITAVASVIVTAVVGFPGPGVVRRYPVTSLLDLVAKIDKAGSGRTMPCTSKPVPRAMVNLLTSRVEVPTVYVKLSPVEQDMSGHPFVLVDTTWDCP